MRAKNFYFILLRAFLRQYQIILLRLIRRVARLFIIIKQKKNPFLNELPLFYTSPGLVLHDMAWISRGFRAREKGKQNATRPVTTAVAVKFAARYTSALRGGCRLLKSRISGYMKTG